MTDKIPQTKSDLERQLSDQLQFLEDSANRYDQGHENEAKRMAITLRILLYDHRNSRSLLGQLELKNIKFLDTAIENTSNVHTAHCALARILFAGKKTQYVALLDDAPGKMTDYDNWWNGVIFEDNEGNKISRNDIILTMADQDGGAHVDPCIRKDYSRLSKGQSLGHMYMSSDRGWVNMQGAELASVRQIAHEVLKSLNPNYEKNRTYQLELQLVVTFSLYLKKTRIIRVRNPKSFRIKLVEMIHVPVEAGKSLRNVVELRTYFLLMTMPSSPIQWHQTYSGDTFPSMPCFVIDISALNTSTK